MVAHIMYRDPGQIKNRHKTLKIKTITKASNAPPKKKKKKSPLPTY